MSGDKKSEEEIGDGCLSALLIDDRKFYISTTWTDEDFTVAITDGINVWRGEAKASYIRNTLTPKGMTAEDYLQKAREALAHRRSYENKTEFRYSITGQRNTGEVEFSWSIPVGGSQPRLAFADEDEVAPSIWVKSSLTLQKVKESKMAIAQYFDQLIDRKNILKDRCAKLEKDCVEMTSQRDTALTLVDKLTAEKKSLEKELYTKFVSVLNEKKAKIRELKEIGKKDYIYNRENKKTRGVSRLQSGGNGNSSVSASHPVDAFNTFAEDFAAAKRKTEPDAEESAAANTSAHEGSDGHESSNKSDESDSSDSKKKKRKDQSSALPSLALLESIDYDRVQTTVRKRVRTAEAEETHAQLQHRAKNIVPRMPESVIRKAGGALSTPPGQSVQRIAANVHAFQPTTISAAFRSPPKPGSSPATPSKRSGRRTVDSSSADAEHLLGMADA